MTPQTILDQVRFLTKTSSTDGTGTDANLLRILNDYYYRQVSIFVNTNEDKFGRKAYTTLNINPVQEYYRLPPDCMRVKRVEVTYDGSQWRKMREIDAGQVENYALDPTSIKNYYNTTSPYYEIYGDSIYLRPIPSTSISLGLKLWYIRLPAMLSNMTATIAVPTEYQGYLAYGVAAEVATRQGNDSLAAAMFQKWEDGKIKIEKQYSPTNLDRLIDFFSSDVNYG